MSSTIKYQEQVLMISVPNKAPFKMFLKQPSSKKISIQEEENQCIYTAYNYISYQGSFLISLNQHLGIKNYNGSYSILNIIVLRVLLSVNRKIYSIQHCL